MERKKAMTATRVKEEPSSIEHGTHGWELGELEKMMDIMDKPNSIISIIISNF